MLPAVTYRDTIAFNGLYKKTQRYSNKKKSQIARSMLRMAMKWAEGYAYCWLTRRLNKTNEEDGTYVDPLQVG